MINEKSIKMFDNSQNDMIKNQIKDFVSNAIGDDILEKTVKETDIDDILKTPDISAQLVEFYKDQNRNDDSFMQGLCVGLDFGFRFGLVYLSKCLTNNMDDIKKDIKKSESKSIIKPTFLN